MNQRWAWLWGTFMSAPLTDYGAKLREAALPMYERGHYGYGLLLGRVFLGLMVSRAL